MSTGPGSMSMAAKAPQPNAARVFINWLLTQEGQTMWSQETLIPTFRVDVPTNHIVPSVIKKPGKVYVQETPETLEKRSYYMELSKQIFAPILPR